MALIDDIRALPAELLALRSTQAIADALPKRKVVQKAEVGDGAISIALGFPTGPVFLYQLESIAGAPLAADASVEQVAQYAMVRQAWRSISKGAFDAGDPSVRASLDLFVGVFPGFGAEQAAAIKRLAEVDVPVSEYEVRVVCWSDIGEWLV